MLGNLFEYKLEWSPESSKYFPEAVRSFYTDPGSANHQIRSRPTISPLKIQQLVTSNKAFSAYLLQGSAEHEQFMVQYFSSVENQPSLLCIIWIFSVMRNSTDGFHMPCKVAKSETSNRVYIINLPLSYSKAVTAGTACARRYLRCRPR